MKKMKNMLVLFISVMLFFGCYISFYFLKGSWDHTALNVFQRDYVELKQVTDYLIYLDEYEFAIIENKTDSFTIMGGGKVRIHEKEICDAISNLFQKGYDRIVKHQNQGVYFERWSNSFHGRFKGFAYCSNNSGELPVQFVVKQKQMSSADWYYYEADYERWRTLQKLNQENT